MDQSERSRPLTRPMTWVLFALPIAVAVLIAACGGATDDAATASGDEPTSTTTAADATSAETTDSSALESDPESDSDPEPGAGSEESDAETEVTPVVYADDFSASIQPIFAERCASCHAAGGPGSPHWELTTAQSLADNHQILSKAIATGYMPPWPAAGDSPAFKHDRSLRDDQLQAVADWSDAGGELDIAGSTPILPAVEVVGLIDPDAVLAPPEPYAGSPTVADDYRCQIYDPELPDGGWITAYQFIPDQTEVVHHAIGYMLPESARERATAEDGADGRPGWQCYGSSGLGADDIFLGWAPGQDPSVMPDGTGLWVEPGGFIVVQIHYHYEGDAPADHSTLAVNVAAEAAAADGESIQEINVSQYIAPAEIPCRSDESGPLCDRDAALGAAVERYGQEGVQANRFLQLCGKTVEDFAAMTDGIASSSCDIPVGLVGGTGEIVSILGHEHEIGSWFKMTLNPGEANEKVLLDIPVWDFDWQYNYEPEERIVLQATDIIRLECGWDRSLRDLDLEPAYVLWADGTNDEMCFGTISTRPPS